MSHAEQLRIAFVQGAKWWEWIKTGATMWQSDQNEAGARAEWLEANGNLGRDRAAEIAEGKE